jgi:hypothetical protein
MIYQATIAVTYTVPPAHVRACGQLYKPVYTRGKERGSLALGDILIVDEKLLKAALLDEYLQMVPADRHVVL